MSSSLAAARREVVNRHRAVRVDSDLECGVHRQGLRWIGDVRAFEIERGMAHLIRKVALEAEPLDHVALKRRATVRYEGGVALCVRRAGESFGKRVLALKCRGEPVPSAVGDEVHHAIANGIVMHGATRTCTSGRD